MSSSNRVHLLLKELGLEYETIELDMKNGEHKKPEFLALNPNHQIPVLVDGDLVLFESLAINQYLCEKYRPALLGDTIEERAHTFKWSIWQYLNLQMHFSTMASRAWNPSVTDEQIAHAKEKVQPKLEVLEHHLEGKAFFLGDKMTVTDINTLTSFNYAMHANYDLSKYPNITRWYESMKTRLGA